MTAEPSNTYSFTAETLQELSDAFAQAAPLYNADPGCSVIIDGPPIEETAEDPEDIESILGTSNMNATCLVLTSDGRFKFIFGPRKFISSSGQDQPILAVH